MIPVTDTSKYQEYLVAPGIVIRVDVEQEKARLHYYRPLLSKFGQVWHAGGYGSRYPTLARGGRCFDNAAELAHGYGLIYCEGVMVIASSHGIATVAHAWCLTPEGQVLDPTCHTIQASPHVKYLGIKFKLDYIEKERNKWGYYGVLDGNPDGVLEGVRYDSPREWLYEG